MTGHSKVLHGVPADSLIRLKPHKLGRHYHKVPIYIKESASKHPRIISDYFLRSFRINIELSRVEVHESRTEEPSQTYASAFGRVGFSIDRPLLAEILECYYGGTTSATGSLPPPNTSELRLSERLGKDVADMFARMVLGGQSLGHIEKYENAYEQVQWEYVAEFRYLSHVSEQQASLFLYLDHDLVDELTSRLSERPVAACNFDPLEQIKSLPLQMDCVVASLQMSLAEVLALRPGDILATRLQDPVEVRVNQQRLFRGSIFEDNGSLFLTALESVKTP